MKPLIWREPSQSQGLWVPALKAVLFCSLQMALFPSQPHITWKSPLAQCVCAVPLSWEVFCLLKTHSLWATKPSKILYLTAVCTLGPKQGLLHSCIQAFYCKQQKNQLLPGTFLPYKAILPNTKQAKFSPALKNQPQHEKRYQTFHQH